MMLTRLEPETIPALWPSINRMLHPALVDEAGDLRGDLTANRVAAWVAHGFAGFGVLVVELADDDEGRKTLWLRFVAGRGGLKRVREALALLETAGREIGCLTARIGGRRGWVRALSDYELISDDGLHVQLRKVL